MLFCYYCHNSQLILTLPFSIAPQEVYMIKQMILSWKYLLDWKLETSGKLILSYSFRKCKKIHIYTLSEQK